MVTFASIKIHPTMSFARCASWILLFASIHSIVATLQVIENPRGNTTAEGQAYVLACKFNEPVDCIWFRNGVWTAISDRYRYVSGNGNNTRDCSVEILSTVAEFDKAQWQCGTVVPASKKAVYSDKVFLDVQENVTPGQTEVQIVEHPKNASVPEGHNHTLTCTFSEPVNCVWTRSKSALKIVDRRQFISNNGMNTTDCSFRITNFTHTDVAFWQCTAGPGPDQNLTKGVASDVVHLSMLSIPSGPLRLITQPKNETVHVGEGHTLECKFNAPVNCSWVQEVDIATVIDRRYHYISNNGSNTPDCSFRITSFSLEFDAKLWQCKAYDPSRNQMVASEKVALKYTHRTRNTHYSTHSVRSLLQTNPQGTNTATEISVLQQPKNASVIIGHDHVLTCVFGTPVNCSWHKDGISVTISQRYQYFNEGGKNVANCSLLITKFDDVHDSGGWECKGEAMSNNVNSILFGTSNKAFLSVQEIVWPNRTEILLDGKSVNEIWVPENGDQNGTLQCVAEYAFPAAALCWNITGKANPQEDVVHEEVLNVCIESRYCNSTLTWRGDWKQLLGSSTLNCVILQLNTSNAISANLKFKSKDEIVKSSTLGPGAIAGIVIAVLIVVLVIVASLVYIFVMKPKKKTPLPVIVKMESSLKNSNSENGDNTARLSPAVSERSNANSTPGHSAETVQMNDRQPKAVPQSPVKVPLMKNAAEKYRPSDRAEDSSESSDSETDDTKPGINTRYSSPFSYLGGKDIPARKQN